MYGLLYKEIVLSKKNLLYIAVGELLASSILFIPLIIGFYFAETETLMGGVSVFIFFMMFLILGTMTARIFEADETKKWAYFISSSPITGKGQIQEKYIFTMLLYIALMVWCYFLSDLLAVFGVTANLASAFVMLCMMLIVNAIEFPFIVRFGTRIGSYVKTAIGAVVMLIAFEYILFGNTSVFSEPEKLYKIFEKFGNASEMSDIALILTAVFPYFSAGLYFLSYKISCKLYLKGAEEYV